MKVEVNTNNIISDVSIHDITEEDIIYKQGNYLSDLNMNLLKKQKGMI